MKRFLAGLLIAGVLTANAEAVEKRTLSIRELGEAVHILINLYNETKKENESLRKEVGSLKKTVSELEREVKELHGKFVLLKMKQDLVLSEARKKKAASREKTMTPKVEIVPGGTPNKFPWITFRRSDVECTLPKHRTKRGYVYYNVLLTSSKQKAINLARNLARAGFCTVVRVASKKRSLYRVVVIPKEDTKEKLKKMGFDYCYYVRNLDLTKSSGGEL